MEGAIRSLKGACCIKLGIWFIYSQNMHRLCRKRFDIPQKKTYLHFIIIFLVPKFTEISTTTFLLEHA